MKKALLLIFITAISCNRQTIDYSKLQAFSEQGNIQAVVEIPAGTNRKIEFDKEDHIFKTDQRNGKDRIINFLPYPGNYGFIPSTKSNVEKGGDGDALDVLILSERLETGTVIEIIPVGILKLIDNNEKDYKIIAVPLSTTEQIIKVTNFVELSSNYPEVKTIIESWFLNYDKEDPALIEGWEDETEALNYIKTWQVNN